MSQQTNKVLDNEQEIEDRTKLIEANDELIEMINSLRSIATEIQQIAKSAILIQYKVIALFAFCIVSQLILIASLIASVYYTFIDKAFIYLLASILSGFFAIVAYRMFLRLIHKQNSDIIECSLEAKILTKQFNETEQSYEAKRKNAEKIWQRITKNYDATLPSVDLPNLSDSTTI